MEDSLCESVMNDFAYEYEQSLEMYDIECMLDRAIEEYDKKAREVADLLRLRKKRMIKERDELKARIDKEE